MQRSHYENISVGVNADIYDIEMIKNHRSL